ncbi:MAG: uncharacterized protein JWM10_83, partial [Myxococcaceae bacterium]|nr:uncharacterized protein [Myxococcaceae bacterium]
GGGACGVGVCLDGYADCDSNAANGCECKPPNAAGACAAGGCAVRACFAGYGDCDHAAANGCESLLASDAANCGACGAPCAAGRACAAGSCVLCAAGQTVCPGGCVDTQTSTAHCGACGRACAAGQVCTAGACITPCTIAHLARCDRGGAAPACCAGGETCETTAYSSGNTLCCVLAQSACRSVADCCYGVPCSDGRCCVRPGGWSPNDETCCNRARTGTTCR